MVIAALTLAVTPGILTGAWTPGSTPSDSGTTETVTIEPAAAALDGTGELVVNGGFEQGVTGWRVNNGASTKLAITPDARSGSAAASLTAVRATTVVLNDDTNNVTGTIKGEIFAVSAEVKSSRPGTIVMLRIREVLRDSRVRTGTARVKLGSSWQRIALSYAPAASGSHLDLNVIGWLSRAGDALNVDAVSMRRTSSTTTTSTTGTSASPKPGTTTSSSTPTTTTGTVPPTTTTGTVPPTTTNPPVTGCLTARGIPVCGGPFVGSAITGNGDPATKERAYGATFGVRRTYYQSNQVDGAIRTVKADLAAGRLPWISFKAPYSWTEMVSGKGDAWAADLATKLRQIDGPVWVAVHHEPEMDGDVRVWAQMQARLSPIIRNGAPNVAFTIIVMGYHQVFTNDPSLSFNAIWPGDGLVDVLAIDPYNRYGAVKNGVTSTEFRELKEFYSKLKAFADQHGTRWAVAETGYTHSAAALDSAWLNRAVSDMESMGGVALAYFDSTLNSDADWTLTTQHKIGAFSAALRETNRIG